MTYNIALFSINSYIYNFFDLSLVQWPLTQHSVLLEPGALPDLVDFMQKVYITQPDIMHIACQLLQRYYQLHPYKVHTLLQVTDTLYSK